MNRSRIDLPTIVTLAVLTLGLVTVWNGWRRVGTAFPGFLTAQNRIVMSVGRSVWLGDRADRILFSEVIAINGHPVATIAAIETELAPFQIGDTVDHRFRKDANVFNIPLELRSFTIEDFFAVYAVYFFVGVGFAVAGWWVTRRRAAPPATVPFFTLTQIAALVLFFACDVYGPHWFTGFYLLVHSLLVPAIWHLTVSYPEPLLSDWSRRMSVFCLYAIGVAFSWLLRIVWSDPPLLLPLVYMTYLMLANTLLIYVGRLAIAWRAADDAVQRSSLRIALAGSLLSAIVPGAIIVFYPSLSGTISPSLLTGPLIIFPLLTAHALRRLAGHPVPAASLSVRRRFALLFLGAAETAYVAAISVSWMNRNWEELLAAADLNHHQQLLVQRLREPPLLQPSVLAAIEVQTQRSDEAELVAAIRAASTSGAAEKADTLVAALMQIYERRHDELQARAAWIGPFDELLFAGLVLMGLLQAVGFMLAVRNWLMRPMEQLTVATGVIATGNLQHRIEISAAEEFADLGHAINSMAASLGRIQQRIEVEREARHQAAVTARDAERRRFGRELHDGVLQDLSAVKLQLEGLDHGVAGHPLSPVIDALIRVIVGLRRVVDDIAAPELTQASLSQAIAAYASTAAHGRGIALQLQIEPSVPIPDWATRDVYRIAQEAVGNAVRHGTPSRLRVMLRRAGNAALLEIEDDGSGFDATSLPLGTGLRAMRERTAAIGAHLVIHAIPGHGTVVQLDGLPIKDDAAHEGRSVGQLREDPSVE